MAKKITSFKRFHHALRHYARALTDPEFRMELETLDALLDIAYEIAERRVREALLSWHPTNRDFDAALKDAIRALEFYIRVLQHAEERAKQLFSRFTCPEDYEEIVNFNIDNSRYSAEKLIEGLEKLRKATRGWLLSPFTKRTRRWLNRQVFMLLSSYYNYLGIWPSIRTSLNSATGGFVAEDLRTEIRLDREFRASLGPELWTIHLFTWLFGDEHGEGD